MRGSMHRPRAVHRSPLRMAAYPNDGPSDHVPHPRPPSRPSRASAQRAPARRADMSRLALAPTSFRRRSVGASGRDVMRKHVHDNSAETHTNAHVAVDAGSSHSGLPNRLMTAFEVAEFVGCHEETVRRAYLRGLLVSQRFGVRGRRFHPADVLDWIRRGAPTRIL